jgi:hypothetical protein
MTDKLSIIPPTGAINTSTQGVWFNNPNLPQGKEGKISAAGWTYKNEGFVQQTFLGASIRSFNLSAGFGDSSSSLTVQLINDEYNISDKTGLGIGDDVYHNGKKDTFAPPPVGSPVFFKFGKNHATVEQAWRRLFDTIYKVKTIPDSEYQEPPALNSTPELAIENGFYYDIERQGWVDLSNSRANDDEEYAGDGVEKFFARGKDHLIFGGILQSYSQNKGTDGNPVYSATIVDPREILSNVQIVLNNYTGSMFGNKNFVNVYGFLEYDISDELQKAIDQTAVPGYATTVEESEILIDPTKWTTQLPLDKLIDPNLLTSVGSAREKLTNNIEKIVFTNGEMQYFGTDMHYLKQEENSEDEQAQANNDAPTIKLPIFLPMTGEGFARRSNQGIPWYRVRQALNAIFEYSYDLPQEYKDKGFGAQIDFRGFNYVVDFSGLPVEKIPQMYFLDFDQIDILSLAQEICDVISHDLYVTLLPVINHPACLSLYQRNQQHIADGEYNKIVAGIIRIEGINRSDAPEIGAIKSYIEKLKEEKDIDVESQNLGYELANITTDKIVVGAQKVDIHFFSDNKDRDNLYKRMADANDKDGKNSFEILQSEQWTLENSLQQQILPFYGFIGKDVPTIPRGFGPYQQILLDATGLDADGIGNYYIATEMELRAAAISYEQWSRFLIQYNETYIEEYGENSLFYRELASNEKDPDANNEPNGLPDPEDQQQADTDLINYDTPWLANRTFGVTVPRCVFFSERNYMAEDGYPASPCSPPFGYPLYYKRAEKIGIPEAGIIKYQNAIFEVISNYEKLSAEAKKRDELLVIQQDVIDKFARFQSVYAARNFMNLNPEEAIEYAKQQAACEKAANDVKKAKKTKDNVAAMREFILLSKGFIKKVNRLAKKHLKNAKKIHEFVKNVADKHLGKTYLVKIPKATNIFYSSKIEDWNVSVNGSSGPLSINNYQYGPFGFEPDFATLNIEDRYVKAKREQFLDGLLSDKIEFHKYNDRCFNFNSVLAYNDNGIDYGGSSNPEEMGDLDKDKIHLPKNRQYYYGGLKVNFNPISDNWEFNYRPSAQGGFFKPDLFPQSLSYSTIQLAGYKDIITDGQKQFLIPMDLSNFEDNGRIFAYVRYDHSEDLDLSSVGRDNLYQQKMDGEHHVPDTMEDLNNVVVDGTETFNAISERVSKEGKPKDAYVAFVKCEVDENLYLLPKIEAVYSTVYGRETLYVENARPLKTIEITDEFGCKKMVPAKPYSMPIFTLDTDGGSGEEQDGRGVTTRIFDFKRTNAQAFKKDNYDPFKEDPIYTQAPNLIDTEKTNLSSDHVYAIITIPGRIVPTIDKRYMDGPYQQLNGADIKHLLTQDTVSPSPPRFRFDKPTQIQGKAVPIDCEKFTFTQLTNAQRLQKLTLQNLGFADPQVNIGFSEPSPVYPNLVAIPLLSTENCYGPWFSSSILNGYSNNGERYKNIGGKVEFVKDENLAPWNYTGYKLMNEAGAIQAQFSNSLLLFSENGGLSYPDAPNGVDLAKPLGFGGPLITSISVDINESSIKTNIRMDLYTSRFGKLTKQREAVIAQVLRERQKLIDQKNYLIRRGFNKNQANNDILSDIRTQGEKFRGVGKGSSNLLDSYQTNKPLPDQLVVSLSSNTETLSPITTQNVVGSTGPQSLTKTTYTQKASMQDVQTASERYQILANEGDENTVNKLYNQTAGVNLSQWITGYSTLPIGSENSANFASMPYSSKYIEKRENG